MKSLSVAYVRVDALTPYAKNARTHSEAQVGQIAASIRKFGWTNPILIDGAKGIIAGHGRLMAAKALGMTEVPVIELSGLTAAEKRAYILADNKLALNAGWDDGLLAEELRSLGEVGIDLEGIGFSADELTSLLADKTAGLTDPDDVPDVPADPVSRKGDLWILGNHRLMCGDSTDAAAVERLMGGKTADLLFTSPPYAQQRDYKSKISDWDALMNGVFAAMPVKDGAQVLVNLGLVHESGRVNAYWDAWLAFMKERGWPLFGWYVWDKGSGLPGNWNGRLAPAHEFIFHFSKGGNRPANKWVDKKPSSVKLKTGTGLRRRDGTMGGISSPESGLHKTKIMDSVIRVTPALGRNAHPAMFPVELCENIYRSFAKAGDWIFEPFSGSGTSIIACEKMQMHCAAVEIAPDYTDVSVRRWQAFTGLAARLDGDMRTFDEIAAERVLKAA